MHDEEPFPGSTVEVGRSVEDYSLQSGGNRTNKGGEGGKWEGLAPNRVKLAVYFFFPGPASSVFQQQIGQSGD